MLWSKSILGTKVRNVRQDHGVCPPRNNLYYNLTDLANVRIWQILNKTLSGGKLVYLIKLFYCFIGSKLVPQMNWGRLLKYPLTTELPIQVFRI